MAYQDDRMNELLLPIFTWQSKSKKSFVCFWSQYYKDPNEKTYSTAIIKRQFSLNDIEHLFKWKNGMSLSKLKKKSINKLQEKLTIVNELKTHFDIEKFNLQFKDLSPIWKIFLLHIISPLKYPMFDQHVCRGYYFITCNKAWKKPAENKDKENVYFDQYIDFFNKLSDDIGMSKTISERKKVDEALWEFGKFLKSPYGKIMSYTRLKIMFKRGVEGRNQS